MIEIVTNTDKDIVVTVRDEETGDPVDLSSATEIKACFKGASGTPVVLGIPINEVQTISFDAVPDAGAFRLTHEGNETVDILFSEGATEVEAALNGLSSLSAVTVAGSFAAGFVVTFAGADGAKDQPLLTATTVTLTSGATPVVVTIVETTQGRKLGIEEVDFRIGKFKILLKKIDTVLLETGPGKDLEIQWVVASVCKAKQSRGVLNVVDSLCA